MYQCDLINFNLFLTVINFDNLLFTITVGILFIDQSSFTIWPSTINKRYPKEKKTLLRFRLIAILISNKTDHLALISNFQFNNLFSLFIYTHTNITGLYSRLFLLLVVYLEIDSEIKLAIVVYSYVANTFKNACNHRKCMKFFSYRTIKRFRMHSFVLRRH